MKEGNSGKVDRKKKKNRRNKARRKGEKKKTLKWYGICW